MARAVLLRRRASVLPAGNPGARSTRRPLGVKNVKAPSCMRVTA